MKTKKTSIIAILLLALFVVGTGCASSKSPRKCDGTKGKKTRMGTM